MFYFTLSLASQTSHLLAPVWLLFITYVLVWRYFFGGWTTQTHEEPPTFLHRSARAENEPRTFFLLAVILSNFSDQPVTQPVFN